MIVCTSNWHFEAIKIDFSQYFPDTSNQPQVEDIDGKKYFICT